MPCKLTYTTKIFKEGSKAKNLLETTSSVKVYEIETETSEITCSDGTPTGEVSSGEEQDAQPESSVLVDLTNSGDYVMQAPQKKRLKHIDMERIIMNAELSSDEINFA